MSKAIGVVTLFVGLFVISPAAFSQSELAGRIIAVTGIVEVIRANGDREMLQRSDPVYVGDRLLSNENSLVQLSFVDSALLVMGCNSSLGIRAYRFEQEDADRVELVLYAGNLRSILGSIKLDQYRLLMEDTVVRVSGGDYAVAISADDTQYFGVYDGSMTVAAAQTENNLGVGANADFARIRRGFDFEELLVYPTILSQSVRSITDCAN